MAGGLSDRSKSRPSTRARTAAALPGNRSRIVATVQQAPPKPSMADLQRILDERRPAEARPRIARRLWSSRFHVQHRVAQMLRRGRILVGGDAAHVHSPAGGQGMNTGIQDANSLARALREVLESGNQGTLDAWEKDRLEIA